MFTYVRRMASEFKDWSPETAAIYGPLVDASLSAIFDSNELQRQSDMTVVGAIHADGTPMFTNGFSHRDALSVRDDDLRIIPHCFLEFNLWGLSGIIHAPLSYPKDLEYQVEYGCCLVVQSATLPILRLATGNRMTPIRVWRLAMHQGFYGRHDRGFSGINYGEIMLRDLQYPLLFPGLSPSANYHEIELLGNVDSVQQFLMEVGKAWVWMSPDRFPINSSHNNSSASTLLDNILLTKESRTEKLMSHPLELLIHLLSFVSLPAILSFASTSRHLYVHIVGCN
ncbi:hypothetical protein BJ138DRAFT_364508 [Hygrophoropsis aurantiaca]|uniref:Uncharacterized protein n=1 Tax=Hygrophoropsis aurantiaca TaxID=72124 RepID=A0ACB8AMQ4_9AGAM|nr:hypothetical protein BJ138DRAFT_364508 [Hygrophoropsis aurantiaca]